MPVWGIDSQINSDTESIENDAALIAHAMLAMIKTFQRTVGLSVPSQNL